MFAKRKIKLIYNEVIKYNNENTNNINIYNIAIMKNNEIPEIIDSNIL